MKNFFTILLAITFFVTVSKINAQEPDSLKSTTLQTIDENKIEEKKSNEDANEQKSSNAFDLQTKQSRPTIKLFGSPASPGGNISYENADYLGDYNSVNSFTVELGFANRSNYLPSFWRTKKFVSLAESNSSDFFMEAISDTTSSIEKFTFSGIFFNMQFGEDSKNVDLSNSYNHLEKSYAFGISSLEGANYKAADIALLNGGGIFWTQLELEHFEKQKIEDETEYLSPIEPRIADGIRFGNKYAAEIQALKVANSLSLNIGVTRSVIYERHLFWKWTGSTIIYGIAHGVLDLFVDEIREVSPLAYPVVNFLLTFALDFGYSELQRDSMNWPFNSAPAYIYDELRFGLSFEF